MGCVESRLLESNNVAMPITYEFSRAKVVQIYDGDTITINALHRGMFNSFKCRIYGINTPEIKDGGTIARDYLRDKLLGKIVNIEVLNNKRDEKGRLYREKYGRLLVNINYDGENIATHMIKRGYAKPYFGGKK